MVTIIKKKEERGRRKTGGMGRKDREGERGVCYSIFFLLPPRFLFPGPSQLTSCNPDCKRLENIAKNKESIFLKSQV